jgi:hypothetical protein
MLAMLLCHLLHGKSECKLLAKQHHLVVETAHKRACIA